MNNAGKNSSVTGLLLSVIVVCVGVAATWLFTQNTSSDNHSSTLTGAEAEFDNTSKENIDKLQQSFIYLEQKNTDFHNHSTQLENQVSQLSRKLEQLTLQQENKQNIKQHDPVDKQSDNSSDNQAAATSQIDDMAKFQAQADTQYSLLKNSLLAETSDPIWFNDMQASLQEVLQDENLQGVKLDDIDCRMTLCQVNLHANSVESAETSIRMLGHSSVMGAGQGYFRFDESEQGGGQLTMMLSKDGYDLPQVQER